MSEYKFINDAKVMAKGQITIPKRVREALGVDEGDRVTFIVNKGEVKMVNSAVYALMKFQKEMKGEAIKADLISEEDVFEWIYSSRNKKNK